MARLSLAALSVAALGCSALPCPPAPRCDIREQPCQTRIAEATACLMETEPVDVPIEIAAPEQVEAASAPSDNDETQNFIDWTQGLALFGLAPADQTLQEARGARLDRVWAYYSTDEQKITIIDRGEALDSEWAVALLVHELTHAHQDAEYGIERGDRLRGEDYDGRLAASALAEGEAVLIADLAITRRAGYGMDEVDWTLAFDSARWSAEYGFALEQAPVLMAGSYFPYSHGAAYVNQGFQRGGIDGVRALWDDVPRSTRRILAGPNAVEPFGGPWLEDLDDGAVLAGSTKYTGVGPDRLGTWILRAFAQRAGLADDIDGLRSDAFSVYRLRHTQSIVGVWKLRWATEHRAEQFAFDVELRWATASRRVELQGRDSVMIAAEHATDLESLPSPLAWGPAPVPEPATTSTKSATWPLGGSGDRQVRCGRIPTLTRAITHAATASRRPR